jgi:hypothetical protein
MNQKLPQHPHVLRSVNQPQRGGNDDYKEYHPNLHPPGAGENGKGKQVFDKNDQRLFAYYMTLTHGEQALM